MKGLIVTFYLIVGIFLISILCLHFQNCQQDKPELVKQEGCEMVIPNS